MDATIQTIIIKKQIYLGFLNANKEILLEQ